MSRIAHHMRLQDTYTRSIEFKAPEPASVAIDASGTYFNPDELYAFACRLMAAADRLRKEQGK